MTCPKCGNGRLGMMPFEDVRRRGGIQYYVCSNRKCDYACVELPDTAEVKREYEPNKSDVLEKLVVARMIAAMNREGFEVLEVGQRKAKGSGTTEGCPDLLVRRSSWPVGMWKALEAKTSEKARRRPKQVELEQRGGLVFVWTAEMAVDEAMAIEEYLKL